MFWSKYAPPSSSSTLESLLSRISVDTTTSSSHIGVDNEVMNSSSPTSAASTGGGARSSSPMSDQVGGSSPTMMGSGPSLGPPTIEEILDEQDLLSELKARNEVLMKYLGRRESLRSLLGWLSSGLEEIDGRERVRRGRAEKKLAELEGTPLASASPSHSRRPSVAFAAERQNALAVHNGSTPDSQAKRSRYPTVAAEVLCADVWTINEGLTKDLPGLLGPLWDRVLPAGDARLEVESASDSNDATRREANIKYLMAQEWSEVDEGNDKRVEEIRGAWARVNALLFGKKPTEMFAFIRSQPNVISRLVSHIESSSVQDVLLRLVALEEQGATGAAQWLASQGLCTKLLNRLSPYEDPSTQATACDLIKSIVALSALTPFNPQGGNFAGQDGQQNDSPNAGDTNGDAGNDMAPSSQRDNVLARELVGAGCMAILQAFIFSDIAPGNEFLESEPKQVDDESLQSAYSFDPTDTPPLPSVASITSSMTHSITVVIELIRKNNSDYSEPHLFHTLRNRLLNAQTKRVAEQGRPDVSPESASEEQSREDADFLEKVMEQESRAMGIVHLGTMLEIFVANVPKLQERLRNPLSLALSRSPLFPDPLTVERFRIIELYAELLHCSSMSILNRVPGLGPVYSGAGLLTGGLAGLEALGVALEKDSFNEDTEERGNDATDAAEGGQPAASETEATLQPEATPATSSSSSNEAPTTGEPAPAPPAPSQADADRLRSVMIQDPRVRALAGQSAPATSDVGSASHVAMASVASEADVSAPAPSTLSVGSSLKQAYVEYHVLPTVIDLFFAHPENNFLHNVVYDIVQQLLNGRLQPGFNRELVLVLFKEARLAERILDAQRMNDNVESRKKGLRLPHMGHLMLIAEEVVKFLHRCPETLLADIQDSFLESEWTAFEQGAFQDARNRDAKQLGGGRPPASQMSTFSNGGMGGDDSDSSSDDDGEEPSGALAGQPLARAASTGAAFHSSFGFESSENQDQAPKDQFSRYLMHETYGNVASSDEDSDDSAGSPHMFPVTDTNRRRGGASSSRQAQSGFDDDDDDAWGEFASAPGDAGGEDPFGDAFAPPAPSTSTTTTTRTNFTHHPFTSADFAEDAFRRQVASEEDDLEGITQIQTPATGDDSFESAAHFLASNWSIPGGDVDRYGQGEEMPPAHGAPASAAAAASPSATSPTSPLERIMTSTAPAAIPSPRRPVARHRSSSDALSSGSDSGSVSSSPETSLGRLHPAAMIGRRSRRNSALSPPDPSLLFATSPDKPLGIGVDADKTRVREDGKLARIIDGKEVAVPQDDVTLAANHARRNSFSSTGSGGGPLSPAR